MDFISCHDDLTTSLITKGYKNIKSQKYSIFILNFFEKRFQGSLCCGFMFNLW